jgi:hypothetical protein
MHDCKSSGLTLAALATHDAPTPDEAGLLAELRACPNCREELASVRNAVRLANDALQSVEPADDFWPGYHDRLQRRLISKIETRENPIARWFAPLTASVRVPLPLAIAMVLLFAATCAFSVSQSVRQVEPPSPIATDVDRPIVPLIRQETVTRVIYVKRTRARSTSDLGQPAPKDRTVAGLPGFKPTSEVKLTIIKGSTIDEK